MPSPQVNLTIGNASSTTRAPWVISNRSSRWLGLFAQRYIVGQVTCRTGEIAQPYVGATLWMRGRWDIGVFFDLMCMQGPVAPWHTLIGQREKQCVPLRLVTAGHTIPQNRIPSISPRDCIQAYPQNGYVGNCPDMGLVLIHVTNAVTNAPLMSLSCVGMCQNTHVTL